VSKLLIKPNEIILSFDRRSRSSGFSGDSPLISGVTTKSDREIDRFTGGVRLKMSFLACKKTRELYHARVLRALRTHSLPRGDR